MLDPVITELGCYDSRYLNKRRGTVYQQSTTGIQFECGVGYGYRHDDIFQLRPICPEGEIADWCKPSKRVRRSNRI